MSAAAAAASTLGVMPLATSSRVAEIRALRVRPFWPTPPCDSYGTDIRFMVLSCRHGTSVPYTRYEKETPRWLQPARPDLLLARMAKESDSGFTGGGFSRRTARGRRRGA